MVRTTIGFAVFPALIFGGVVGWVSGVHADGYTNSDSVGLPHVEAVATPGSDASFDKRLPPVLPGEEVSDGKNRMKMWSTSGPVPVSAAPEPWKESPEEQRRILGSGVGVIVDRRDAGDRR
jgi:hypothetical protein